MKGTSKLEREYDFSATGMLVEGNVQMYSLSPNCFKAVYISAIF